MDMNAHWQTVGFCFLLVSSIACGDGMGTEHALPDGSVDDGSVDDGSMDDGSMDGSMDDAAAGSLSLMLGESAFTILGASSRELAVDVVRSGGFAGDVTITVTGLPAGVTADPLLISAGSTSGTLTFHADIDVPSGNAQVTVEATGEGVMASEMLGLMTQTYPEIMVMFAPDPIVVPQSGMNSLGVSIVRDVSYTGTVEVALTDLPPGVIASPNPLVIGIGETMGTIALSDDGTAELGDTTITATTTFPMRSYVNTILLTVAPPPSFTMSLSQASLQVVQGASASVTVDVMRDDGFTDALSVTSAPDPLGVTTVGAMIDGDSSSTMLAYDAALDARLIVPTQVSVQVSNGSTLRAEMLSISALPELPNHLDPTFGTAGLVMQKNYAFDYFRSVVVSGSQLIVGGSGGRIYGFDADGSPDTAFGTMGVLDTGVSFMSWRDGGLDSQGRAIFCGRYTADAAVVRVLSGGTLDPTFGDSGVAHVDFGGGINDLGACLVMPDDGVLVAGAAAGATNQDFAVARLDSTGAADTSFNTTGSVLGDLTGDERAYALAYDGNHIYVAGTYDAGPGPNSAFVAKLDGMGAFVDAFGTNGIKVVPEGRFGLGVGVLTSGEVAVIVTGFPDQVQVRLDQTDGSYVAAFGTDGVQYFTAGSTDAGLSISTPRVLPDGAVVTAGSIDGEFGMVRLAPDGTLDASFGDGGYTTTVFGDAYRTASCLAVDGNGDYVVVGSSETHGVIARYLQ
jgi:uncharacterized delta-60 repeat protein